MRTKTFHGDPQRGTGLDQVMFARGPWHEGDIFIHALAVTHRCWPRDPNALVMVGSTGPDGDILAHVHEHGFVVLPAPMRFGGDNHVDAHVWAKCKKHEIVVTFYYACAALPYIEAKDMLPVLRERHSVYAHVPAPLSLRELAGGWFGTARSLVVGKLQEAAREPLDYA